MKRTIILAMMVFAALCVATIQKVQADPWYATVGIGYFDEQDSTSGVFPATYEYVAKNPDGSLGRAYPVQQGAQFRVYYGSRMAGQVIHLSVGAFGKYVKFDKNGVANATITLSGPGVMNGGVGTWDQKQCHILIDPTLVTYGGLGQYRIDIDYVGSRRHIGLRAIFKVTLSSRDVQQTDSQGSYLQMVEYGGPRSWSGLLVYDADCEKFAHRFGPIMCSENIYARIRNMALLPGMEAGLKAEFPMAFVRNIEKFDDGWKDADTAFTPDPDLAVPVNPAIPPAEKKDILPAPSDQNALTPAQAAAALTGTAQPAPVQAPAPVQVPAVPPVIVTKEGAYLHFVSDAPITVVRHQYGSLDGRRNEIVDTTTMIAAGPAGRLIGNGRKATFTVTTADGVSCDYDSGGNRIPLGGTK